MSLDATNRIELNKDSRMCSVAAIFYKGRNYVFFGRCLYCFGFLIYMKRDTIWKAIYLLNPSTKTEMGMS